MQTRYIDFSEPSIVCRMVELGEGILPLACNIPRRLHNVNFIPIEDSMKSVCCYFIFRKDNPSKSLRDLRRTIADFSSEMKDGILQQNGK